MCTTETESENPLPIGWWIALICAAVLGAITLPALVATGMRQLGEPPSWSAWFGAAMSLAGGGVAGLAVVASRRADSAWSLPALFVWASLLGAAATCDALTQRIPASLVRTGGVLSAALVALAAVVTDDWRGLLLTLVACAAAGAILLICWRFAGAGFGDVRLAIVGGIGLGHVSHRSLVFGILAIVVLTMAQAILTFVHTRDRKAHLPYGPGLALGFLVAAAA